MSRSSKIKDEGPKGDVVVFQRTARPYCLWMLGRRKLPDLEESAAGGQ